jgi:AcrR family transcriptional regulator
MRTVEDVDLLPPGLELTPARRRLYEVAIDLFGNQGYHAVSIRDIAEALGQQPSAIYFHVSSKLDLLFELELIGHRMGFGALRDALMDAGSDPREQLAAVARAHMTVHLMHPALARVANREMRALAEDQLREVLAIRAQAEQIFIDVVERGVRMGVFHAANPFLVGKAVGAMGVRLPEWWTPDAPVSRAEVVEQYVEYALKLVA